MKHCIFNNYHIPSSFIVLYDLAINEKLFFLKMSYSSLSDFQSRVLLNFSIKKKFKT